MVAPSRTAENVPRMAFVPTVTAIASPSSRTSGTNAATSSTGGSDDPRAAQIVRGPTCASAATRISAAAHAAWTGHADVDTAITVTALEPEQLRARVQAVDRAVADHARLVEPAHARRRRPRTSRKPAPNTIRVPVNPASPVARRSSARPGNA